MEKVMGGLIPQQISIAHIVWYCSTSDLDRTRIERSYRAVESIYKKYKSDRCQMSKGVGGLIGDFIRANYQISDEESVLVSVNDSTRSEVTNALGVISHKHSLGEVRGGINVRTIAYCKAFVGALFKYYDPECKLDVGTDEALSLLKKYGEEWVEYSDIVNKVSGLSDSVLKRRQRDFGRFVEECRRL